MADAGGAGTPVHVRRLPAGLLGEALDEVLSALSAERPTPVSVIDCGGGSGSLAVPLAVGGAQVTVVDTSIDALGTLARRAAEAGVSERVRGIQADVESLGEVVAPSTTDLVLLHGVVRSVVDGELIIASAAAPVRPGGYLSVVAANPAASVLARAFGGDLSTALAELTDTPSRLDLAWLQACVERAGLDAVLVQGLNAFSATVPGSAVRAADHAAGALQRLDREAATLSPYRDIAGQLHVLARRPVAPAGAGS